MISKLRFSLVAVIMLVLLGFGFQNQAQGQIGTDGLFCPAVPNTTGWLETNVEPAPALPFPDFSGALIGSVDSLLGGPLHGGMDWQHVDFTSFFSPTPTNEAGSQLVSWWTQKDGRNTYLQVTNALGNDPDAGTWVHVHIFDENCVEIRNFCDFYTEFDTHVYNFGDLVSNVGVDVPDGNLQSKEGFVTVTAVDNCPTPGQAIEHNWLAGNTFVKSVSSSDYMYGFATYHRKGVCFDVTLTETINLIENGSFQNGPNFGPWVENQGNASGISEANISVGTVPIPPASGPDADNPNSNVFMGFAVSSASATSPTYGGGPFPELAQPQLIDTLGPMGFETNVTVVTSNTFVATESNTLFYDLSFLSPTQPLFGQCDNYAMVCVIDDTTGVANFENCRCYNQDGDGTDPADGNDCVAAGTDFQTYNVSGGGGNFSITGGRSGFFTDEQLSIPSPGTYAVQVITGQIGDGTCDTDPPPVLGVQFTRDNGAFVDNFRVLETVEEVLICDGILDGSDNAFLDIIVPNLFAGQFDAQNGTAGADVVHINFYDEYLPSYTPQAAFVNLVVGIWNDVENFDSCGEAPFCFVRLGIDEALILSDNFVGPPTTAPPTTPPTLGPPTTAPPTTTPGGGGGSGSCAIAGNPVQLGTAFANVLIPLIPIAFVFGIRAMRRRKK
jgi:hypothetical protein